MRAQSRFDYLIVFIVGLSALLVSYVLGSPRISGPDETYYVVVARNLVENGSLNTTIYLPEEIIKTGFPARDTHMPGYMILLALPTAIFGPTDEAFLIWSQFGYLACGFLVFWAGQRLFSRAVGFVSALSFFLYPLFFFYANTAMTEIALQLVAMLLFCVWLKALDRPRLAHVLAMSLLLTVGTSMRLTFVLFVPPAVYAVWRWPSQDRGRAMLWFAISLIVLMATIVYPLSMNRAEGSYKFFAIAEQDDPGQVVRGFLDNFILQASRHVVLPRDFPNDHIRLVQMLIAGAGLVGWIRLRRQQRAAAGYFVYTALVMWSFLAVFYTPSGSRGLRNLLVVMPPGLIVLSALVLSAKWRSVRRALVAGLLAGFAFFAGIGTQSQMQARRDFYVEETRKAEVFEQVLNPYRPAVVLAYKPWLYSVRQFPVNVIRRFPEALDALRALQQRVVIDAVVVDDAAERDRLLAASRQGILTGDFRPVNMEPESGYYFLVRGALFRRAIDAVLGEDLVLQGVDAAERIRAGDPLPLTLVWQARNDIRRDYVIAVRLRDEQGQEAQYWLGRPVLSTRPTFGWRSGEVVADTWDIVTTSSLPGGHYRLEVEVYDAASVQSVGVAQVGVLQVEASN